MEENFILKLPEELSGRLDEEIKNNLLSPLKLKKTDDNKYTLEYKEENIGLKLERFPTIIELFKSVKGNYYKTGESTLLLKAIKSDEKPERTIKTKKSGLCPDTKNIKTIYYEKESICECKEKSSRFLRCEKCDKISPVYIKSCEKAIIRETVGEKKVIFELEEYEETLEV